MFADISQPSGQLDHMFFFTMNEFVRLHNVYYAFGLAKLVCALRGRSVPLVFNSQESCMTTGYERPEATAYICDLAPLTVNSNPFPHVIHDEFINPKLYRELRESFPTCPPGTGPTGYSLFWGDDEYDRLLAEHSAWRVLFNTFHNQNFGFVWTFFRVFPATAAPYTWIIGGA